jgi:hypothetical protein
LAEGNATVDLPARQGHLESAGDHRVEIAPVFAGQLQLTQRTILGLHGKWGTDHVFFRERKPILIDSDSPNKRMQPTRYARG